MRRRITNYELRITNYDDAPHSSFVIRHSSFVSRHSSLAKRRGFTLIELIVVIAIIGILVGLVLPGASRMWAQRNEASAVNLVRGLLSSARSQARRSGERGLFFYVDPEDDVQRIAFIEAEPPNAPDAVGNVPDQDYCRIKNTNNPNCVSQPMAVSRFIVTSDKVYTVPSPFRVAPKHALLWAAGVRDNNGHTVFQRRLGNDLFDRTDGEMRAPRQRNHFTVLFNRAGQLVIGRDVLIHDQDANSEDAVIRGDKTQLRVTGVNTAMEYYRQQDVFAASVNPIIKDGIDPNNTEGLSHMICHEDLVVANFPSVDGLVVYDNSAVEGLDGKAGGEVAGRILADVLLDDGRPIYITRQTGDLIMGEKGL